MIALRHRTARAEAPPETDAEAQAREAVLAACEEADAAALGLARALEMRAEALRVLQRLHRHPQPSLIGKALGHDAVEQGLAWNGVAGFTSLYVAGKARRSFVQQARGLFARHPTQQPKEG
jgi:hypothetical protein